MKYSIFNHREYELFQSSFSNILNDSNKSGSEFLYFEPGGFNQTKDTYSCFVVCRIFRNDSEIKSGKECLDSSDFKDIRTHKLLIYNLNCIYKYSNIYLEFKNLDGIGRNKRYIVVRHCFNPNILVLFDDDNSTPGLFLHYIKPLNNINRD